MGTSLTILLTVTAAKFLASQHLPRTSNLTVLDSYIVSTFIPIFGIILVSTIIAGAENDTEEISDDTRMVDIHCGIALFFAWMAWNVLLIIRVCAQQQSIEDLEKCFPRPIAVPEEAIEGSRIKFAKKILF